MNATRHWALSHMGAAVNVSESSYGPPAARFCSVSSCFRPIVHTHKSALAGDTRQTARHRVSLDWGGALQVLRLNVSRRYKTVTKYLIFGAFVNI